MADVLEAEICFDFYHLQRKHHQVVEMINKIDKNVNVVVRITNIRQVFDTDGDEACDPKEELINFVPGNPLPIKKGLYEITNLTDDSILDTKDLLDFDDKDTKNVSFDSFQNDEFVIKCKLCQSVLTNQDEFKTHNESQTHYMKYAADFCQRRKNYKERKKTESNNWGNENIGQQLFDILYPIQHQISKLDIGGKIVLQPGTAGQVAARECFEEILSDILMSYVDNICGTSEDSGIE